MEPEAKRRKRGAMLTRARRRAYQRALDLVFGGMITEREHRCPGWDGTSDFLTLARDGTVVYGWVWDPAAHTNGTLILVHGFRQHCGKSDYWHLLHEFGLSAGMAAAALDLRHHGHSGDSIPTFGLAESWDVAALLDELELRGCPRPFILIGDSLGGMAVQCLAGTDPRVNAAICLHTPGWPRHAVRVAMGRRMGAARRVLNLPPVRGSSLAANLIDTVYGFPAIDGGDVRTGSADPFWRPPLLYVMGTEDHYGIRETRAVWERWYPATRAKYNVKPSRAPDQNKWFVEVEGAGHPGVHPSTLFQWRGLWPVLDEFINIVGRRGRA